MPSLGADMEAGTLVEQLIAPGQPVKRGDVIGAVETQKGVIEIEVFEDGVLETWLIEIGTEVPVGTALAVIRSDDEVAEDIPPEPQKDVQEPVTAKPPPAQVGTRPRITPAARRLMAQMGVDAADLDIAAGETIARVDIETRHPRAKPKPQADMRTAIAAAMSRSKREIPHYYLSHTVDLTAADAFATRTNAGRSPEDRLLITVLYAKAIARAVGKYPEFNGHFKEDLFHPSEAVHLGLATHIRGGGLVAAALLDAEDQPLDALMASMRDLVTRVRAGRFKARELSDATITLTSLGERGVDQLYGVIYPPQVAIVGVGTQRMQPVVHEGQVTARLAASLTLAADHRVSDGHRGALFLRAIDKFLQEPETL